MRIKELAALTGVRKETIHYYTRENLLPEIVKTSNTQSQYSQVHVDRINLIKGLQERLFMPLSAIRKLIQTYEDQGLKPDRILMEKMEYLDPLSHLLEQGITGENAFIKATGIAPDRVAYLEETGFLEPRIEDGEKQYSFNDLTIGRIMGDLRRKGISTEKGFGKDTAMELKTNLSALVGVAMDEFYRVAEGSEKPETLLDKKDIYITSLSQLVQHLFIGLAREYRPKQGE